MHRSTWLGAVRVWALVAMLVGLFVAPAQPGLAQPSAPAATTPQQIVTLTSDGYIQIYGVAGGVTGLVWKSSTNGWGNFALGDFDSNGFKEIVATKSNVSGQTDIAIFDPKTSTAPIASADPLSSGYVFHLLVTGHFDGAGDQVVYTYTDTSQTEEWVYEWAKTAQGTWQAEYINYYAEPFQDLASGDINGDGWADLSLVRNIDNRLLVLNGQSMQSILFQNTFATDWYALAVGDAYSGHGGNELVATRKFAQTTPPYKTELIFGWNGSTSPYLFDITPATYSHNPGFTDVALGNLTGNATNPKQMLLLRDPLQGTSPFILMIDPSNVGGLAPFQPAGDFGATAWKKIAAGDVDGDGRDEVIVVRDGVASALRVYDQPEASTHYIADTGVAGGFSAAALEVGDLGLSSTCGIPVLATNPTSVSLTVPWGQTGSALVQVANSGSGGAIPWTAARTSGGTWLQFSPAAGTTPGSLTVTVSASSAGIGTNTGEITITGQDGCGQTQTVKIPVSVSVPDPGFIAYPSLVALHAPSGSTAPVSGSFEVARPGSAQGVTWQAAVVPLTSLAQVKAALADGSAQMTDAGLRIGPEALPPVPWLTVNPETDVATQTPKTVTVTANPTLAPQVHNYAAIVLVPTNPFNPDWVRTVEVGFHKGMLSYLPFVGR